jgi:hypothetical protein
MSTPIYTKNYSSRVTTGRTGEFSGAAWRTTDCPIVSIEEEGHSTEREQHWRKLWSQSASFYTLKSLGSAGVTAMLIAEDERVDMLALFHRGILAQLHWSTDRLKQGPCIEFWGKLVANVAPLGLERCGQFFCSVTQYVQQCSVQAEDDVFLSLVDPRDNYYNSRAWIGPDWLRWNLLLA